MVMNSPPGSQQSALVDQVFQIRAGKARGPSGQFLQIHILRQGLTADVDLQNLLPAPDVQGSPT